MVIFPLEGYSYIIRFEKKYTEKQFLRYCNVTKDTYGENFALEIYNTVIGHAIDIRQEFKKYYSCEYKSIQDFLFWKYYVPDTYFDEIFKNYKNSTFIGIFKDYSWFHDEDGDLMTETILSLLKGMDD